MKPTLTPTVVPTTEDPSPAPTNNPTFDTTVMPSTNNPSADPSLKIPSPAPTEGPSPAPSNNPTFDPTGIPSTNNPSADPTDTMPSLKTPSTAPTTDYLSPSSAPSSEPSEEPSVVPTSNAPPSSSTPSAEPSSKPSEQPASVVPSHAPPSSSSPSSAPSSEPSEEPSVVPTSNAPPSSTPSTEPSSKPSEQPSISQSIIVTTTCYVERIDGQGEFVIPCEDIDETYFQSSATLVFDGRHLASSNFTSDFYVRDMKMILDIENRSNDILQLNSFIATLKGISNVLIGNNDDLILEPNTSVSLEEIFLANLSSYSTTSLLLKTVAIVTGRETDVFLSDFIIMTP
jgi:hypothetical protein